MKKRENIENLLDKELKNFYEDEEEILNILLRIPKEKDKERLLAFMGNMEIKRSSQIESMVQLINREKTETDKKFIRTLFELWNSSDFVFGAFLPLDEDQKKTIIDFVDKQKGKPKEEIIDGVSELVVKFLQKRKN
ncbi:MAG: hypothetical protein IJ945_04045 [Oscillospiraceae bacterium]|nr:hypothetical protein [Oscillospiraceae bacterium]